MTSLILASASPARLMTLRRSGVHPRVVVSRVDEPRVIAEQEARSGRLSAADVAQRLADAKAADVAGRLPASPPGEQVVLGCDSVLELDGEVYGKPATAALARARWQSMRGRSGVLHTGHCLIDPAASPAHPQNCATASTTVTFADLGDAEIEAYVATGEPLAVAGGFTVDGLGAPYVTAVSGDFHNVVGLSLPLLRVMLAKTGVSWHAFRAANADPSAAS